VCIQAKSTCEQRVTYRVEKSLINRIPFIHQLHTWYHTAWSECHCHEQLQAAHCGSMPVHGNANRCSTCHAHGADYYITSAASLLGVSGRLRERQLAACVDTAASCTNIYCTRRSVHSCNTQLLAVLNGGRITPVVAQDLSLLEYFWMKLTEKDLNTTNNIPANIRSFPIVYEPTTTIALGCDSRNAVAVRTAKSTTSCCDGKEYDGLQYLNTA
jgi:hypothetical protein